ncbi:MAG: ABC transporter permease [Oscillospiraceae bacterium]|nr:ABC transporter permease [Oscillospiraceae bacterium]
MRYVLKKACVFVATLLVISVFVFLAFQIIPGDPTTRMLGTQATPEKVEALREELGLNAPPVLRYFRWLKGFVTGDFGMSYSYNMPVNELLSGKLGITAALTVLSFIMVVLISFPLGILLARFAHSLTDRLFMLFNQIVMSIPPFFVGIIFTYIFGLVLKLFTPGEFIHHADDSAGFWGYLFFPALAIALPKSAMVVKILRSSMVSQLQEDYVRTAFSRGNSHWRVLRMHVLRNAIIPVVTFLAVTLVDIFAASIIIEQVFAIPGLGRLLLGSITGRDLPVVQTIIMIIAVIVITVNFIADISYKYIDPRIRFR